MKNLIDEIEKTINSLKEKAQKCYEDPDYPISLADNIAGQVKAYKNVLDELSQYNIITAPKSIKLSEIIERLKGCKVERYSDYISLYDTYTDTLPFDIETEMKDYLLLIKGNKIEKVHCIDKWLYTLWIAGTEIVDDMEEEE